MIDRCVLIIDDEKRITDSLTDLLAAENFSVQAANSGADGIAILEQRSFPVVVTDLRMQGLDGLNVIRHIHEHQPKTLVIVITGYASTESAIEALHYQAFDYIQKPFDFSHLKASIDRAFHKLEVDQLREDTAAMITHDIKVPLTSVLGFASLMVDKKTGRVHPQAAQFAEKIRSNAQRILA
ncbi:response regulator, partial [Candidatus Sumerlaeota bacterium]|nr:response regulator [Candidatus Sumerlaeota bacterium]